MLTRLRSAELVLALSVVLSQVSIFGVTVNAQEDGGSSAKSDVEIRIAPDPNQPITRDGEQKFSPEEQELYFKNLKQASETPLATLREAADKLQDARRRSNPKYANVDAEHFPQFYDLVENPDAYRGHAVSLRGTLRRLTKSEAGKNSYGVTTIYEGWLYTADSQSNPTVVVFTEKPAGLELGSDITEEVRATGYFFKIYGYESEKGPGTAPMLLAGTIELNPGPRHYVFQPLSPAVYVGLAVGFIVVVYGMWKAGRPRHVQSLLPPEEPKL